MFCSCDSARVYTCFFSTCEVVGSYKGLHRPISAEWRLLPGLNVLNVRKFSFIVLIVFDGCLQTSFFIPFLAYFMIEDCECSELIKWAGKSSSLSPLKPRSNRPRQYNIRLRLPLEICESVASGLIRTLCEHTEEIPSGGKLLLCKV